MFLQLLLLLLLLMLLSLENFGFAPPSSEVMAGIGPISGLFFNSKCVGWTFGTSELPTAQTLIRMAA